MCESDVVGKARFSSTAVTCTRLGSFFSILSGFGSFLFSSLRRPSGLRRLSDCDRRSKRMPSQRHDLSSATSTAVLYRGAFFGRIPWRVHPVKCCRAGAGHRKQRCMHFFWRIPKELLQCCWQTTTRPLKTPTCPLARDSGGLKSPTRLVGLMIVTIPRPTRGRVWKKKKETVKKERKKRCAGNYRAGCAPGRRASPPPDGPRPTVPIAEHAAHSVRPCPAKNTARARTK